MDAHWPLVGSSLCVHHLERANIHETSQQRFLCNFYTSKIIQSYTERERKRDWERKNEKDVWLTVKITKIRNQGTFEQASCGKASNTFKNKKE